MISKICANLLILNLIFVTHYAMADINRLSLDKNKGITLTSFYRSYFSRKNDGRYKLKNGKPYHIQGEGDLYGVKTSFFPSNTAFFVIDPWDNMPSAFLNKYYGNITNNYILPLVRLAKAKGYNIYIFTNNCKDIKPVPYSCSISKKFYDLTKNTSKVKIVYWQGLDPNIFSEHLKKLGITKIIYTGFASNMCILERPTGMFKMKSLGFSLYFIPKASAAVELSGTWDKQYIHKAATDIISQSLANITRFKDIHAALIR